MKIKTKYDLIKKIKHSIEGVSGNELFFDTLKKFISIHVSNLAFFISHLVSGDLIMILINAICYIFIYVNCNILASKTKDDTKNKAEIDLQKLVNELSKLEVKTSMELLQEAKINQIDYKIEYKDSDKIPRIRQYKYIDIPLSNGYEETILQEHSYFDKDYELSVNSPIKKYNYKTARNNI